jgi:hypothetical protein
MGVNPVHFQGAYTDTAFPVSQNTCSDIWPQHSWQFSDHVSREDVARAIYDAEEDIARIIGYYPAPKWICQEVRNFDRYHRRDMWRRGLRNVRGDRVSVQTEYTKVIQPGRRATTLIDTATTGGGSLVYSDEDGDGFAETATVTLATTLTDVCELKVYFSDTSADPAWEIRPPRSKTITGGNVQFVFDSWLFIDPDVQAAYPTVAGFEAIDISSVNNYVSSVDVYREYTDSTAASAVFMWEPQPQGLDTVSFCCTLCSGSGCPACVLTTQDGCLHIRDAERGYVVPTPAAYNSTTAQWDQSTYDQCRDATMVSMYYYAGEYDNRWLCGHTCEPLSNFWAHTIAWIATARLDRDPCQCGTVQKFFDHLRQDLAMVGEQSHQLDPELLANPLGTRRGEIMAWQRMTKIAKKVVRGGAI